MRSEHTFFRASPTAESITGLTRRADWGQTATHRMQPMQADSSTFLGSSGRMAWTGHSAAQRPHRVQSEVGLGTSLLPLVFL